MNFIPYFFFYPQRYQLLRYLCNWKHSVSILIDYLKYIFRTGSLRKICDKFLYWREIWIVYLKRRLDISALYFRSAVDLFLLGFKFFFQTFNGFIKLLNFSFFFIILSFSISYLLFDLLHQNSISLLFFPPFFWYFCFFQHVFIRQKLFLFLTRLYFFPSTFFFQLLELSLVLVFDSILYFFLLLDSTRFHFHILEVLSFLWDLYFLFL